MKEKHIAHLNLLSCLPCNSNITNDGQENCDHFSQTPSLISNSSTSSPVSNQSTISINEENENTSTSILPTINEQEHLIDITHSERSTSKRRSTNNLFF